MVKSRMMGWAGNVARMRRVFDEKTRRKEPLEDTDMGGRIILNWVLEK
jgi:hypothetical protein